MAEQNTQAEGKKIKWSNNSGWGDSATLKPRTQGPRQHTNLVTKNKDNDQELSAGRLKPCTKACRFKKTNLSDRSIDEEHW